MTAPAPLPVIERRECEPPLGRNIWPAFGKPRVPGDILFWPRSDQRVLGIPVHFTHWAVYVGRRKLSPCGTRWMVDTCEVTGETLPEAVVHLWGAPDAADRDMSSNAVVVHNRLDEVGGTPYDGNLCYDKQHTPRRPEQILHRVLYALGHKLYEDRFGKYDVVGNNCEHFCTWARYGLNQSDQIGNAVKFVSMGLGALFGGGAPGAIAGGYISSKFIQHTHKMRRQESLERERAHFDGDGSEDVDGEVDWVVECLVRHVEDAEAHAATEREAHATGRAHRPRGGILPEDAAEAEGGAGEGADGGADGGARRRSVEIFSLDSHGNVGGHVGHFFNAVLDGMRGDDAPEQNATRDGAPDDVQADAEANEKENGDANGTVPRPSASATGAATSASASSSAPPRSDRREREPGDQVRDVVAGVGNVFGALLGGMIKVGGAVVSEIGREHERHRERLRAANGEAEAAARIEGVARGRGVIIEEMDPD